jgi:hypothetical protein
MDTLQFTRLLRSLDSLSQQFSKISSPLYLDNENNIIQINSHLLSNNNTIYKPNSDTKATFCILLYTHSEYSFLWKAAIPLLEKYASEFTIYWCCDSLLDYKLPGNFIPVFYDPKVNWSFRIKEALKIMNYEYVLYLQEDCLLIDNICPDKINYLTSFMKEKGCEFLMSDIREKWIEEPIPTIYEDYEFQRINGHWMQPAIWKKTLLDKIVLHDIALRDNEINEAYEITKKALCYVVRNTRFKEVSTRTLYFPHMHSIVGGKWTFFKYPTLKALLESYGIDTSTRGVDKTWIVDYQ